MAGAQGEETGLKLKPKVGLEPQSESGNREGRAEAGATLSFLELVAEASSFDAGEPNQFARALVSDLQVLNLASYISLKRIIAQLFWCQLSLCFVH
ncbi:hypothetical protein Tcan_18237 [Toxocara canis]|uniref:Uncharacterized protein n=1 Tax=Toxocara canis TaxID=6265 RepID=A0A0B2V1N3_TOXCA|nr:hypothetical protein Tcan_18237 [Toxocara canis]